MSSARAPFSLLGFGLLLLLAACGGSGAPAGSAYPPLTGRVVDNADLLPPADEAALTQRLEALQRQTSRQLVVATVPEMGGYEIEEYANGLFRHWQLGQRTANNGVLLLVARSERKLRIEVGYNMEAIVTDAFSGRVIREQIAPRFRQNDYSGGIRAGADALIAQLQAPPEAAEQAAVQAQQAQNAQKGERRRNRDGGGGWLGLVFWLFVVGFILLGAVGSGLRGKRYRGRRRGWGGPIVLWGPDWSDRDWGRRNDGWGGGSWGGGGSGGSWGGDGGGGFSGGGGSSGGGGASGSW